jgi:hypothetical protein
MVNHARIKRGFPKLNKQAYPANRLILRIPTRPRHHAYPILEASDYQPSCLDNSAIRNGSITLAGDLVSIALSKNI